LKNYMTVRRIVVSVIQVTAYRVFKYFGFSLFSIINFAGKSQMSGKLRTNNLEELRRNNLGWI
jgi:hypothetical protein